MMRTKQIANKHENDVASKLSFDNARRSPSSGANPRDRVDVSSTEFVIECEATEKKSKSFKKDLWTEVRMKSHNGKTPLIALRFHSDDPRKNLDLIVMELDEFIYREKLLREYGCNQAS